MTLSSNGAPVGSAVLKYRKNGGAWETYPGGSIAVAPGDTLQAQNVPVDGVTGYLASDEVTHQYYRLASGFSGSVEGGFSNATGEAGLVHTITSPSPGTVVFSHGQAQTDLGNGEVLETGEPNVITFTAQPFTSALPNQWFTLGDITLLNGEIFNDTAATGVTLNLSINMGEPSLSGVANVALDLINTTNSEDRLASADVVQLRNPASNLTVTIEGISYRLELAWQNVDPVTGVVNGNEFLIFEGGTASGRLRGRWVSDR